MQEILSPLTGGSTTLQFSLDKQQIIDQYKNELDIDVAHTFEQKDRISLYKCNDTGYRFFKPSDIDGDGKFYESLEKFDWYYAENKWDYETTLTLIDQPEQILDIGCGEGKFLYLLEKRKLKGQGLELNTHAIETATQRGLQVINETVQEHALKHSEKYDLVTFFQVLEHIDDISSFLQAAIACTKIGGQIIIAVPNNDPYYLTRDKYHTLNIPPHHMGWWDDNSLTALEQIFPIKLKTIKKETLRHFKTYTNTYLEQKLSSTFLRKILHPFVKVIFYLNRKNIAGAGILAQYERTA